MNRVRLAVAPRVALLASVAFVSACRGQTSREPPIVPFRGMHEMPRYDAQERGRYFEDGRAMRPEIAGTVSREMELDGEVDSGLDALGEYVLTIPARVVDRAGGIEALMRRGHERYDIYCAPCHGATGDGRGMVSLRAAEIGATFAAANLLEPGFQHMPDGRLYATIANGVRTMPAYRYQVPVQDRWAIVAYVRALQVSQGDASEATADADGDGLPTGADACPEQPEDRDGFDDLDGCPDPDNDGDGIPDGADACPLSAGPGEGCAGLVTPSSDGRSLRFARAVVFEPGRASFARESLPVLDELRAYLAAHPEVTRISIEGHTAADGDEAVQRLISERRARAVMQWLVEHGIDPARMTAVGLGSSRPIADNAVPAGREANRRIDVRMAEPSAPGGV